MQNFKPNTSHHHLYAMKNELKNIALRATSWCFTLVLKECFYGIECKWCYTLDCKWVPSTERNRIQWSQTSLLIIFKLQWANLFPYFQSLIKSWTHLAQFCIIRNYAFSFCSSDAHINRKPVVVHSCQQTQTWVPTQILCQ